MKPSVLLTSLLLLGSACPDTAVSVAVDTTGNVATAERAACDAACVNAVRMLWARNDTQGLVEFWRERHEHGDDEGKEFSMAALLDTLAASTRNAELCRLTLFRDILSGPTTVLTEFGRAYDFSSDAAALGGVRDDDVTSLRLDGEGCSAVLYEHSDQSGWKAAFEPGEYDLNALVRAGGANDEASSLRLEFDPQRRVGPGQCRLVLFRDDAQQGPKTVLARPGKYNMASLSPGDGDDEDGATTDVKDDDVTSLRLDGEGCSAALHEHSDLSGWKADFGPGVYDLADIMRAGGRNDATSAVRLNFPPRARWYSGKKDSKNDAGATSSRGDDGGNAEDFQRAKLEPPSSGLGSLSMPATGCEQLRDAETTDYNSEDVDARRPSGPYWINTYDMLAPPGTSSSSPAFDPDLRGPFLVYCLLSAGEGDRFRGGGWTLLLATAGAGTEFVYGADHWTQPTTLEDNPDTLSSISALLAAVSKRDSASIRRHSVDAKMSTFNRLRVREFMAYWPSIDDEYEPNNSDGKSNGVGPGNAVWHSGPISNTTALRFFDSPQPAFSHRPQAQSWWHDDLHSSQRVEDGDGVAQFGVNVVSRTVKLRWGYAFNDNSFWDTSIEDAHGGVGTNMNSAADKYELTEASRRGRVAPQGGRPRPALIFGRTATEALEGTYCAA